MFSVVPLVVVRFLFVLVSPLFHPLPMLLGTSAGCYKTIWKSTVINVELLSCEPLVGFVFVVVYSVGVRKTRSKTLAIVVNYYPNSDLFVNIVKGQGNTSNIYFIWKRRKVVQPNGISFYTQTPSHVIIPSNFHFIYNSGRMWHQRRMAPTNNNFIFGTHYFRRLHDKHVPPIHKRNNIQRGAEQSANMDRGTRCYVSLVRKRHLRVVSYRAAQGMYGGYLCPTL